VSTLIRCDVLERGSYVAARWLTESVATSVANGAGRAFTLLISSECIRLFQRRRRENRDLFLDGDEGWVPTRAIKDLECSCTELGGCGSRRKAAFLEKGKAPVNVSPTQALRDTALVEVGGTSPVAIDVLTNQRPLCGSVTAGYIDLSMEHLAVESRAPIPSRSGSPNRRGHVPGVDDMKRAKTHCSNKVAAALRQSGLRLIMRE
jgi:hypothetical protein